MVQKQTLEEVVAYYKRQRSEAEVGRALVRVALKARELKVPTHTPKKWTRLQRPITKGSMAEFNAQSLKGVPGGGLRGHVQLQRMIEAEETGTRLATPTNLRNLERSAQNCNTTQGNYNSSNLHR